MSELADGRYDVIVVDVETIDESTIRIDLAMVQGDRRGEVIAIRGPSSQRDPLDLLGLPGVIVVDGGNPRLVIER